jgi:hypothetical protein
MYMVLPSSLKESHTDKSENPFDGDTLEEIE